MNKVDEEISLTRDKSDRDENNRTSYWKSLLKKYEKRNASLERRRLALVEKVHFMEYALPSILIGAAAIADSQPDASNLPSQFQNSTSRKKR